MIFFQINAMFANFSTKSQLVTFPESRHLIILHDDFARVHARQKKDLTIEYISRFAVFYAFLEQCATGETNLFQLTQSQIHYRAHPNHDKPIEYHVHNPLCPISSRSSHARARFDPALPETRVRIPVCA